jgi:hypothetical protein
VYTVGTILSWALAVAPAPIASEPFSIDDVEFYDSGNAVELVIYDLEGEVTAELVLWTDLGERTRLEVNFADREWMFVDVNGAIVAMASSDTERMIRRLGQVADVLDEIGVTDDWGMCIVYAAELAASCEAGDIISCMAAAVHFAC